jgi:hypothetical protein
MNECCKENQSSLKKSNISERDIIESENFISLRDNNFKGEKYFSNKYYHISNENMIYPWIKIKTFNFIQENTSDRSSYKIFKVENTK